MPTNDPSLTFISWQLPPLRSGTYQISVEQQAQIAGSEQKASASQGFLVAGARYRLDPAQINSLSPRNGDRGDFARQLPHVVLNAASLPWQRVPNPKAPAEPGKDGLRASWLAVLLFDESDPPPEPKQLTLADLKLTEPYCAPQPDESGEDPGDPVTVIDVEVGLFNAIAPTLKDLNWNAHVRRVDPKAKASSGGALPARDYAVVVGNRLPATGHSSVAHLVSLENHADCLPDANGQCSQALAGKTAVRLVSLASWAFSTRDEGEGFSRSFAALDRSPAALQMPWQADGAAETAGDARLKNAFGLGYSAMPHRLRNGDHSLSWYRGPLLPVAVQVEPPSACLHPDQLLRFDPASGMFDVSYSAAWQLGRLLALNNSGFASTLYRWKLGKTQEQLLAWEKATLDDKLGDFSSPSGERVAKVLAGLVPQAVQGLNQAIDLGED